MTRPRSDRPARSSRSLPRDRFSSSRQPVLSLLRWQQDVLQLESERTHLSHLRTAITLVALGVGLHCLPHIVGADMRGLNATALRLTGIGVVACGLVLVIAAIARWRRVDAAIEHLDFRPRKSLAYAVTVMALAVSLAAVVLVAAH